MEAAGLSEILIPVYQIAWPYIPEERIVNLVGYAANQPVWNSVFLDCVTSV
jgi:hypothetical protein